MVFPSRSLLAPPLLALLLLSTVANCQSVNNLARSSSVIYGSAGEDGIVILSAKDGSRQKTIARPSGFDGVHDVAVDGNLVFALDGAGGSVGVYTASDSGDLTFVSGSRQGVSVGPYAGVSAGGGKLVASGGTGSMSVFSYTSSGELTELTDSIDLGTGQPDVLVDSKGDFAYVSTDFSGSVDGSGFGITTVDLNSDDISSPSTERVGLKGAGFTQGVATPANFPIESAISGDTLLVAHGGGLSVLSLANRAKPSLTRTVDLPFPGVNVDADGDSAVVVGVGNGPQAARVSLDGDNKVETIELSAESGARGATGVAIGEADAIVVAAGSVITCNGNCSKKEGSGGSSSAGSSNGDGDDDDDNDVCVDEKYLLARGLSRDTFLHKGAMGSVLCPNNGLPCGTPNHVVRFQGDYVTYREMCAGAGLSCRKDRMRVNGVSMRYAKMLCTAADLHCVVPHVMRSPFEMERMVIGALHRRVVNW